MDVNRKELSGIKEVLKESPRGMTVTEISKAVKMNRHSVAKYLEVLVVAGHVDMKAFGPSKVYYLSQRVPVSAMLSFSTDLILILDKDLRIRNLNDKFLEYMGLRREDVLNKNIKNFAFTRLAEPPLMPGIEDALKGIERTVNTFYKSGDSDYYFVIKFLPTVFEDGQKGATIIASDYTEHKRIEEAVMASERKFRNMLEQSTDGIIMSDEQGVIIEYNNSLERMIGFKREYVVGKRIWELPFFEEAYRQIPGKPPLRLKDYADMFLKTGESPLTDRFKEFEIGSLDGAVRAVHANIFPIKTDSGFVLCAIVRDVTEQKRIKEELIRERGELEGRVKARTAELEEANEKLRAEMEKRVASERALRESEERFRRLVESVNDVVWEKGPEGKFTYMSPKIRDAMGYDPEEFIGKTILDFMFPSDADAIREGFRQMFREPAPYCLREMRVRHKDGHEVIVEANGIPVYDEKGMFCGYRGVTRDVSRRAGIAHSPR